MPTCAVPFKVALGLGLGLGLPNPRLDICNENIRALCEPLETQVRRLTVHYLIRAGLHYKDGREFLPAVPVRLIRPYAQWVRVGARGVRGSDGSVLLGITWYYGFLHSYPLQTVEEHSDDG